MTKLEDKILLFLYRAVGWVSRSKLRNGTGTRSDKTEFNAALKNLSYDPDGQLMIRKREDQMVKKRQIVTMKNGPDAEEWVIMYKGKKRVETLLGGKDG